MSRSKFRTAVGLRYEGKRDEVPSVTVREDELLADEVVRIARRFGIPVVEQPHLAQALRTLAPDEEIPAQHYEAAAIVLNELEHRSGSRRQGKP